MYKITQSNVILRLADGASIPADPANTDYATYLAWLAEANTPQPVDVPTPAQIEASITGAIQKRLDDFAKTRGYDGILSACTYVTSAVPKFAGEGAYCVQSRDATWAKGYEIMAQVQAGTRPMPSGFADIEAELPALVWP